MTSDVRVSVQPYCQAEAEEIGHQPIKGSHFYSLHSGPYRIPYLLDKNEKRIIIDDIAKHDPAYDRISKL